MKLIPLTILLTSLAVDVIAQKYRQDFSFPPQFQTPNVGLFSSDSSLYLPPESHTALPYYPIKNVNNLQYPLLPPTGTKAPSIFPSPFPFIMSTTLVPNFDDDDDDEDSGRIRLSSPPPIPQRINYNEKRANHTAPEPVKEKREMRPIPKNIYPPPIPIQNRNDIKFPFNLPNPAPQPATQPPPPSSTPATRRMIISSETQRSDIDQVKAPSFLQGLQGPQFLPAGQGIYVSSSTEPAIPILRLSNEMDLDGSFSYEVLGADQTHYVQHSRMENMGTDKEEQVVEGSYSYVGDNGHTYTVHYVADANGFRASGDHLPVPPPVPEIIQRAVQYNLAEEAKKPPHLKSWRDDGRDNEIRDSEKVQQFSLPPTRNLFTGRTPEAFSYSFSQGSNTGNNLVTAASNQASVKTVDYTTEPPKANNGPISPQITFLASQGAHLPSLNNVQNTISRMFATDKPALPQIVNYEAQIKEAEQEPNKGLWRWQYGINANNLNQNPNKDTISRSSGEGDDVIINFSDMTPDQYTKMIQSQLEYQPDHISNQYTQNLENDANFNNYQAASPQLHNSAIQSVQYQNLESTRSASSQNYYQNMQKSQNSESEKDYRNAQNLHYNQNQQNSQMFNGINSKDIDNKYNSPSAIQNPNNNNYVPNIYQYHESSTLQQAESEVLKQYPPKSDNSENLPTIAHTLHQTVGWTTAKSTESRKLNSERSKILTHKDFAFPSETVTQSYDFEESFYEPRKIKALVNVAENSKPTTNSANQVQNIFDQGVSSDSPWDQNAFEVQQPTTPEPYISTLRDFKFTDFIVQESKSDFKPVVTTTTTEATRQLDTTTENILEDILQNNVFLKNLFSQNKSEKVEDKTSIRNLQEEKQISDEPKKLLHTKVEAEPKTDKVTKLVQFQPKPINDIKLIKKKPLDIAELLNYMSMKGNFESSKVKPKGRINNHDQISDVRFIPVQHEREENEVNVPDLKNNVKTMHKGHQEELRGQIKNYKVLQRNNNSLKYDNRPLKTELSPPPLKSPSLPPLGRAGPSMKSYLPPIYV